MKWNNRKAARIQLEHKHRVDLMVSMEDGDEFAPLLDDPESAAKLEAGTLPHSRQKSFLGFIQRRYGISPVHPSSISEVPKPVLIRPALDRNLSRPSA
ncbi:MULTISPECIES: hypothetical protein [unclassified Bradyrhizobium]|uniref:hypothetical protein n=1 Tax=unclassified Bradyrhizobium TaxID=2631580 RepID=UPI002FF1A675